MVIIVRDIGKYLKVNRKKILHVLVRAYSILYEHSDQNIRATRIVVGFKAHSKHLLKCSFTKLALRRSHM